MLSVHDDEEPDFLEEVRRRAVQRIHLRRRGEDHGHVVELRREGLVGPRPRRKRRETIENERWTAARPILLPRAAEELARGLDARALDALRLRLAEPGGLAGWLEERRDRLQSDFELRTPSAELFDPERDVARAVLAAGTAVEDLWLKVGRLSTHARDESLRLRVSFGVEGDDDASEDRERHGLVRRLAERLLPGARELAESDAIGSRLRTHLGETVYGTQHIAYWNAPHGGARFHHDAFAMSGDGNGGQRGVLYTQLTGSTFWLALSIHRLLEHVREFLSWLDEGDAPELRERLGPRWTTILDRSARYTTGLAELSLPDAGLFGAVVNAPEFTGYLTDAGHGLVLHPGDALLLPNHGLDRTAMHSVFCASERPGYALSVALRLDGERNAGGSD